MSETGEMPAPPVEEAERRPERQLINKEMAGAQAALLLGRRPESGKGIDRAEIEDIARGAAPDTRDSTNASRYERTDAWNQGAYKDLTRAEKMQKWEERTDAFLGKQKGTPQEELLKNIGIDLAAGTNARDIYQTLMKDQKGDIGYFAQLVARHNTAEQIDQNRELIQQLAERLYGKNSAQVSSLLAEGIKNAQTDPEGFTNTAQEQAQKGDQMPGADVIKNMQEHARWVDKSQNPQDFMGEEVGSRLAGTSEIFKLVDKSSPIDGAKIRAQIDKYYPALANLASIIAHENNPDIPAVYLTPEEAKRMKPLAERVSKGLGKVSAKYKDKFLGRHARRWEERLDSKAESTAGDLLDQAAGEVIKGARTIEGISDPQQQFVKEMKQLYDGLTAPEANPAEYVSSILSTRRGEYPLLGELAGNYGQLHALIAENATKIGIAAPEVIKGLETFLRGQGVADVQPAQIPKQGWLRSVAEEGAPKKLALADRATPEVLRAIKDMLPTDGYAFSRKIYGLAESIVELKQQGRTNEEIRDLLVSALPAQQ